MTENERAVIEQIVMNTVKKLLAERDAPTRIPLGVSNKHIHLTQEDVEILFGEGHTLTPIKDLGQPGQFACEECIDLEGPKAVMKHVRVLGPARAETQIEISMTMPGPSGSRRLSENRAVWRIRPGLRSSDPKDPSSLPTA